MAAKNTRDDMIDRIRARYRSLRFDHFHYRGLTHKSVFHCVQCGLNFRQTPDSLLLERKNGTVQTPACGCRLELVEEWDLPEKFEESKNE